ncbi:hypothetical protein NDU88_004825 [Pleurodeles waltl]|uniref:Uncharacterized protein n=1 Tax=Pleurodeles waltl TaxID=8319 RepID=A0AAV7UGC4_PLEWA|nr:hypothetical protein NDU88_004825 [Pleurodeles waltl]
MTRGFHWPPASSDVTSDESGISTIHRTLVNLNVTVETAAPARLRPPCSWGVIPEALIQAGRFWTCDGDLCARAQLEAIADVASLLTVNSRVSVLLVWLIWMHYMIVRLCSFDL